MDTLFKWLLVKALLCALLVVGGFGEGGEKCHPAKTCGKCMTISLHCAWCKDVNKTFEGSRCDLPKNLKQNKCGNITYMESKLEVVKDKDVQDQVFFTENDTIAIPAVPITPQQVDLKLRLGGTKSFDVRVLQVNDYPVDLYYLMDLSYSMLDDLNELRNLGRDLAKKMKTITRSFALGFGSFVDKPVAPYISIAKNKIDEPCSQCQKAYSFRNELSLNQNTELFEEKVNNTTISGNLDIPEGTFDAIMQAAVCKEQIGWREDARKLLLVTTDASFHIEGDGKLAGIISPNDGECHLTGNEYSAAHLYDYPSIAQLNQKLIENNIILIFAVSKYFDLYQDVSGVLQGAISAHLSSDSRNIVDIVSAKYQEITGAIELANNAIEGVEVKISSDCKEGSHPIRPGERPICTNIHEGDEILFHVEVTATRCVDQTFEIYPIGFDKRLTVNVVVECNCSCELEPEENSTVCSNGNGDQVCGICQCQPGRYGDNCECTGESEDSQDQSQKDIFCKPDNTTAVLCSGRGECICGECRCNKPARQDEVISGTFCECNNQACPREDGEVCGGSERGECLCAADGRTNECRCRPGYTGQKCNCPTQVDTCRSRNGLICNAAGKCKCGKCECEADSKYSGPRCDECVTCTDCDLHIACVQCKLLNNTENLSAEECDMCSQIIKNVTKLPERNDTENACSFSDNETCSISFVYETAEDETIVIYVKGDRDCAHSDTIVTGIKVHILILYIILGIIFIGLLLVLLYRLYIWRLDRIEYLQFIMEKENAHWDESQNPLYKSSTSTVQNPLYGRSSVRN